MRVPAPLREPLRQLTPHTVHDAALVNPYPGPRPFEDDQQHVFSGRDHEARTLFSLVVSHRLVILYAQSGAGKTSLLNAKLLRMLRDESFEVYPVTRLRAPLLEQEWLGEGRNAFTTIAVAQWANVARTSDEGSATAPAMSMSGPSATPSLPESARWLVRTSLNEFFEAHPHVLDADGEPQPRVIVFDQFEELFTSFPHRWRDRAAFLDEVTAALERDPLLRVVVALRDDMIALLEAQGDHLPQFGVARMRLERLDLEQARLAIIEPAVATGRRTYHEKAVEWLLNELRSSRVELAPGKFENVEGEYVEPVQLQIVCQGLWHKVPPETTEITKEQAEKFADVTEALRRYYDRAVEDVASSSKVRESVIRTWFGRQLITQARTRGTAFREETTTAGLPNAVVDALDKHHIIRAEARSGGRWYELTHDRFIVPILDSNRDWRASRSERRSRAVSGLIFGTMLALTVASLIRTKLQAPESTRTATAVAAVLLAQADSVIATDPTHALELVAKAATVSADSSTVAKLREVIEQHPLAFALIGHTAPLRSASYSADGRYILTTSEDSTARIWDAATGRAVRTLRGHRGWVMSGAFSPDGRTVVTAARDSMAIVWDATTGEVRARLPQSREYTRSVRFVGSEAWLVTTGDDQTVRIWESRRWTRVPHAIRIRRGPIRDASMSAGPVFGTVGDDGWLRLWWPGTWTIADAVQADSVGVLYRVAFGADKQLVAVGHDGGVRVWRTRDLKPVMELQHRAPVYGAAFTPDARTLVTGARDSKIRLWSVSDGRLLSIMAGHVGPVYEVRMSPNTNQFVTAGADNSGRVWNLGRVTVSSDLSATELVQVANDRIRASPEHP